jgi:hypothetical protein
MSALLVASGEKSKRTHKIPRLIGPRGLTNQMWNFKSVRLAFSPEVTNMQ